MGVATSIILGAAGLASTGIGMAQQQTESDYNADLAELEGREQKEAMDSEARRLSEQQQELKASQRVTLAAGGAGSQQTQPLMLLADQANKMQLDQIEMRRQGRTAQSRGRSRSLIERMRGKQKLLSGTGSMIRQGYGVYQSAAANRKV
jgi:hypothetical protein